MFPMLITLYALAVLWFLSAMDDEPDSARTRSEAARAIGTALAWPLYHVQWRSRGQHHAGRRRAQLQLVAPTTGMSGAVA